MQLSETVNTEKVFQPLSHENKTKNAVSEQNPHLSWSHFYDMHVQLVFIVLFIFLLPIIYNLWRWRGRATRTERKGATTYRVLDGFESWCLHEGFARRVQRECLRKPCRTTEFPVTILLLAFHNTSHNGSTPAEHTHGFLQQKKEQNLLVYCCAVVMTFFLWSYTYDICLSACLHSFLEGSLQATELSNIYNYYAHDDDDDMILPFHLSLLVIILIIMITRMRICSDCIVKSHSSMPFHPLLLFTFSFFMEFRSIYG